MSIECVAIRGSEFEVCECKSCGVVYAMPRALRDWDRKVGGFKYCPNGHQWGWRKEDSEDEKIRRERDQLKQETARLQDELGASERNRRAAELKTAEIESALSKTKSNLIKMKKRTAAGVCPCCNRTFLALTQHIAAKHPKFRAEDVARENVVSLVKSRA